jgi:hypothetical protein
MARKNQTLWLMLGALGAFYLYQRSTIATAASRSVSISSPDATYIVDEQGRKYWLDAEGNIAYATDAAGNRVAVPEDANVSAASSYYPPGSLQSVYL